MHNDEDVSMFIGCLPGQEERQILLFPGGQVLADIRGQEVGTEWGISDRVDDHGWIAACELINTLTNGHDWYIEEVTEDGNGWWLKPRSEHKVPPGAMITGLDVDSSPTERIA